MTNALDQKTIDIIKSTVPVLEQHGNAITKHFYERMLSENPELNNIFNQTNQAIGHQPKALAATVYAAAANIDNLGAILPRVKQISEKHKSLSVKAEHYPIVGKYLLLAIKEVLGDAATDEIIDAWAKAYGVIADVFIGIEEEMYQADENAVGGWKGFREFKVAKKVKESEVISSFYLEAADGKAIENFKPGQYITIKADIPGEKYTNLRQYSLSGAPGESYYRISVKREDGMNENPKGDMSSYLHQAVETGATVQISPPSGDFVLDTTDTRPLVLISRGVGLTPTMSMLNHVIKVQPEREVYFIHATYNEKYHALKTEVENIATANKNVHTYTVYNKPIEADNDKKKGLAGLVRSIVHSKSKETHEAQFDHKGYVDYEWLKTIIPTNDAAYYFCGPEDFMRTVSQALKKLNVADADIHYEFFGPAGTL